MVELELRWLIYTIYHFCLKNFTYSSTLPVFWCKDLQLVLSQFHPQPQILKKVPPLVYVCVLYVPVLCIMLYVCMQIYIYIMYTAGRSNVYTYIIYIYIYIATGVFCIITITITINQNPGHSAVAKL